jgi:hypothetical protein
LNLRAEGVRFLRFQADEFRVDLVLAWLLNTESAVLQPFVRLIEKERKAIGENSRRMLSAACGLKS